MRNLFKIFLVILSANLFFSCGLDSSRDSAVSPDMGGSTGKSGSMARFAIARDRLYVVDENTLRIFNITDAKNPVFEGRVQMRGGVETIFAYGSNLFFGTQTGLDIYSIANPSAPAYMSTYTHITACDPVVVQGNLAYVTLRGGRACGNAPNVLEVIDVTEVNNPRIVNSLGMQGPYGLGVDRNLLFVCEGQFGFKTFALDNPVQPRFLANNPTHDAFDLIAYNNILMVIGKNGLFQYSYKNDVANPDITFLSKIPVNN
jgi:hypothetical protein